MRVALIQPDWCPYRKREGEHRHTEGGHLRTQEQTLAAQERSLRQTDPASTLTLDPEPPDCKTIHFLLFYGFCFVFRLKRRHF